MQITKTLIQNLQVSFSKAFEAAWRDTPEYWTRFATRVSSQTKTNTYGWMQRLLKMRKWEGPRLIQNLATQSYFLENEKFELTVGVGRTDIQDDQIGIFGSLFKHMGRQTKYVWNDLAIKALRAGSAANIAIDSTLAPLGTGFDSVAFFGSTHNLDPAANQANEGSEELTEAGWDAVKEKMANFRGEDGRLLGVRPSLVVVPSSGGYERAAKKIFGRQTTVNGDNTFQGEAQVIVVPELPAAEGWYAFDTSAPIQAIIMQIRKEVEMVAKTDLDSDNVFWQDEFVWGADCRGAAGYGPWFLAYHATGTSPNGNDTVFSFETNPDMEP